jgi:hypothetical protein
MKGLDVDSTMQFVTPETKHYRRYVIPGAEFNTGIFEVKNVHIRDVRPIQEECKLDITGFQLFRHESRVLFLPGKSGNKQVTDFMDTNQVEQVSTKGAIRHSWRSDTTTKTLQRKSLRRATTMTRPIKSDAQEKEDRLQLALTAFSNGEKTASEAIRDYNIPRKTFYH